MLFGLFQFECAVLDLFLAKKGLVLEVLNLCLQLLDALLLPVLEHALACFLLEPGKFFCNCLHVAFIALEEPLFRTSHSKPDAVVEALYQVV